jgi:drug/metabolite transporter (DMT)-like permease
LLLVLATLFWSGNFVLGRAVHEAITPLALSFWRWAVALLILLPFAWPHVRQQWPLLRRHPLSLLALGVLGVTNFNTFVYLGLQTTTATSAVLMVSTTPVLILALSRVLLGHPVSPCQASGVMLSLAGAALILAHGEPRALLELSLNRGDLWVLAAVLSWALYSVCLRWRPPGVHPLAFLAATVGTGLLLLLPLYLWDLGRGHGLTPCPAVLGAIAYVALFPSVLAYVFWNRAVAQLGPGRAGHFMHLMPVFGALLSRLLLGERLRAYHLAGIALIAAGIWLATLRRRAAAVGPDDPPSPGRGVR